MQIGRGPAAADRIEFALGWLAAQPVAGPVLIVAPALDSANELARRAALRSGAAFGWQRITLGRLAAELAQPESVEEGRVPVGALACEAIAARVLQQMRDEGALGRLAAAAEGPGLPRAAARTLGELREARADTHPRLREIAPELAELAHRYASALEEQRFADRATVLTRAAARAGDRARRHPLLDCPLLLLDVPVRSRAERELLEAVASRAPALCATLPSGDERSLRQLEALLGAKAEPLEPRDPEAGKHALGDLQSYLFDERTPAVREPDPSLVLFSAPGESRESIEIARHALQLAGQGVPFDRMAVLLRSPDEYRPHLEEAFARARIPACFARGAVRPDPSGRAFVALLACAQQGLSANRFAEYLSLGEVPDPEEAGAPPPAAPPGDRWGVPDAELLPAGLAALLQPEEGEAESPPPAARVPAPRRWERLLVDASVIGGIERWRRRLDGRAHELALELAELGDPDDPAALRLQREARDLEALRAYALPLLEDLAALPREATWSVWLDALSALASRALRHPERVLGVLAELAPMAEVGPVELREVLWVIAPRLQEIAVPPPAARYGRVYVAPAESARGMDFDAVFVPGLAERLFPRKISEDPVLLDAARRELGGELATQEERIAEERLALRLAVGAAKRRVILSYPRLDLDQGRPRVPSFYALEALRAGEGRLPGFDELAKRAETVADARVGWPAPRRPHDAIDEAEHDLALLESLLQLDPAASVGTARYLLSANPHLGRALRFRARRWLRRWTSADGLVTPDAGALEAIAAHRLDARSYSPTALQKYASCPYQFFLYAVLRLAPRQVPERIEELDPLQRGSLFHEVQFRLLGELREAKLLPLGPAQLDAARRRLEPVLDAVAAKFHDELAPAIERVWEDGIAALRADLREWLRQLSEDASGFVPWRFELAFGLPARRDADPASVPDPVALDSGLQLRGSIDLVEQRAGGALRATDHKTGKERTDAKTVIAGGASLQPVLYALTLEKMFPDQTVEGGRLFYCTATGGFSEHTVPLDAQARAAAEAVARAVGGALAEPFLPAAPAHRACEWCDFQVVCGPYEELRSSRKPQDRLAALAQLRSLP